MALSAITLSNSTLGTVDTTNLSHNGTYNTLQEGDTVNLVNLVNDEWHWGFGGTKPLKKVAFWWDVHSDQNYVYGTDEFRVYYIPPGQTGATAGVKPAYVLFHTFTAAEWSGGAVWVMDTLYHLYYEAASSVEAEGLYLQSVRSDFYYPYEGGVLSLDEMQAWEASSGGGTGIDPTTADSVALINGG